MGRIDLRDIMAVLSEADLKTVESGLLMVVKHLGLLAVLLGPPRAHFQRR